VRDTQKHLSCGKLFGVLLVIAAFGISISLMPTLGLPSMVTSWPSSQPKNQSRETFLSAASSSVVTSPTDSAPVSYDLNLDGVVDVQDLMILLPYYGKHTPPGGFASLYPDYNSDGGIVDLFDFVAIATHFGPVPCPLQ